MARKWKIIIGAVVALVVVACVAMPILGAVLVRGRFHAMGLGWPRMDRGWMVDEDEDGVPEWGEGRLPRGVAFERGWIACERSMRLGPGRGMGFGGRAFGLFSVVRGLFDLVLLAAVVVLGGALYRQRRKAHAVTPPPSSPISE
ncbi:MAG: hypothetical protein JW918_10505 [Anaerolineae bacterium]|nr:hypothetical protein [Anaerolineae bacterium]